jgi:predicted RNA-binding protein with PUA-like domain
MGTDMEERVARIIRNVGSLKDLVQFETNARDQDALTDEIKGAIKARSIDLGRALIADKTGLDLSDLSPAEEIIVQTAAEYVAIKEREGSNANRTLLQLRNRGLIEAAETSVAKSKPTQGFGTLADADRSDLSYEQIILDHPDEFSSRAIWFSRRTLGLPNESARPPAETISKTQTRTEALLKWFQTRSESNGGRLASFTNAEAAAVLGMTDMHQFGRVFGNIQSRIDFACYIGGLPPLGLAADAPFDKAWSQQTRDWAFPIATMQAAARSRVWSSGDFDLVLRETQELPGQAHISWKKAITGNEAKVKAWAFGLQGSTTPDVPAESPYWVFVCNPKKWAIDQFLDRAVEHDTWGVRPSDRNRFAPGQLGIIRVGVDRRTAAERNGNPPLQPGIYALCEVESEAFDGTGAGDEFWAEGESRAPGWPTVKLRYLRNFLDNPLTIEKLRAEKPDISELLLNGFQASSFPISARDFRAVLALLGEEPDDLPSPAPLAEVTPDKLAELEKKYLHASPEVKERLGKTVERGPIGRLVKIATGFKCQLCDNLGLDPIGFLKKNGEPYVEAHHVMPVAKKEVGSLSASNVMTLCANHHRQMHYGAIDVVVNATTFDVSIEGTDVNVPRLSFATTTPTPTNIP